MAGGGDHSRSLKEALIESLNAILSPLQAVRLSGEEQIKALEVTEEFGVHLAELTVDQDGPLAVRQLASVLLRQYVEAHWSNLSDKVRPPVASDNAKAQNRAILPMGLKETISKVRSSVTYAVAAIAHWDWPESWPELFPILMEALTSGDPNTVHGAMRVLSEFTQDVTDTQMGHVAPLILPEMYKIFTAGQTYSIRTRSRAVSIFNVCAGMIAAMTEVQKGVAKQLLFPLVPQFTQAFVHALQIPDGEMSDSGLKMEVVKAITTLVRSFPKLISKYLDDILPPVWMIFTHSADLWSVLPYLLGEKPCGLGGTEGESFVKKDKDSKDLSPIDDTRDLTEKQLMLIAWSVEEQSQDEVQRRLRSELPTPSKTSYRCEEFDVSEMTLLLLGELKTYNKNHGLRTSAMSLTQYIDRKTIQVALQHHRKQDTTLPKLKQSLTHQTLDSVAMVVGYKAFPVGICLGLTIDEILLKRKDHVGDTLGFIQKLLRYWMSHRMKEATVEKLAEVLIETNCRIDPLLEDSS